VVVSHGVREFADTHGQDHRGTADRRPQAARDEVCRIGSASYVPTRRCRPRAGLVGEASAFVCTERRRRVQFTPFVKRTSSSDPPPRALFLAGRPGPCPVHVCRESPVFPAHGATRAERYQGESFCSHPNSAPSVCSPHPSDRSRPRTRFAFFFFVGSLPRRRLRCASARRTKGPRRASGSASSSRSDNSTRGAGIDSETSSEKTVDDIAHLSEATSALRRGRSRRRISSSFAIFC